MAGDRGHITISFLTIVLCTSSKQTSKRIYLLMQFRCISVWSWCGPAACASKNRYSRISIMVTHLPISKGWTAEMVVPNALYSPWNHLSFWNCFHFFQHSAFIITLKYFHGLTFRIRSRQVRLSYINTSFTFNRSEVMPNTLELYSAFIIGLREVPG